MVNSLTVTVALLKPTLKLCVFFRRTVAYAAEKLNDPSGTIQNQAFHSRPHAEV